jgi:hypothetical protein
MAQAPERIFADWVETFGAVEIGTWADTVRFSTQGTEYIRADLVPQWQPIETAPKDGRSILLCMGADADGKPIDPVAFDVFCQVAAWWGSEEWIVYCSMVHEPRLHFSPTHWMPLPAPPSP